MAVVFDVGMPSVSSGISVAVTAALFAASGPATPSMAPVVPNSCGFRPSFFSVASLQKGGTAAAPRRRGAERKADGRGAQPGRPGAAPLLPRHVRAGQAVLGFFG